MTTDYLAILKSGHSSVRGWSECEESILGRKTRSKKIRNKTKTASHLALAESCEAVLILFRIFFRKKFEIKSKLLHMTLLAQDVKQFWFYFEWNEIETASLACRVSPTCERMGCLRIVGSFNLEVSFEEYCLFYRALLQKRPIILKEPPNRSHPPPHLPKTKNRSNEKSKKNQHYFILYSALYMFSSTWGWLRLYV